MSEKWGRFAPDRAQLLEHVGEVAPVPVRAGSCRIGRNFSDM
jgi:hypothetical protein